MISRQIGPGRLSRNVLRNENGIWPIRPDLPPPRTDGFQSYCVAWCSVAFVDSIDRMRPRSFLADRVQQTPGRTFRWHGLPVAYIVVGVNHMTRSHVAREKNKE